MAEGDSLWQRSMAWRWTFCFTVLLTALCILAAPWRLTPAPASAGQYTAQPPSAQAAQAPSPAPVIQGRASLADAGFDRPVTVGHDTFASGTEMHVVGVYGPARSGSQSMAWLQACQPVMGTPQMIDCKRQFDAAHPGNRTITVEVERSSAPVVLVLMAYEAVVWKVSLRPGIDLRKVIVSGYSGPDIQGVPPGIPVEVYSHEASPCANCSRQPGGFWAYDASKPEYIAAMARLKSLTGLVPTSFQGGYQGDHFTIQRWQGNRHLPEQAPAPDDRVGQLVSNAIDLAGKTLLLPTGVWEVIAMDNAPAPRGKDRMLVLARIDTGTLQELMVTHLELANDNSGFAAYAACNRPADYAARQEHNQPGGAQACYWVNHSEDPWQQPVYRAAASLLKDRGIKLPDSALVSGFHKANGELSVTTQYYTFADAQVGSGGQDWARNPWNPGQISQYAAVQKVVRERTEWASGWFMLVNAMH